MKLELRMSQAEERLKKILKEMEAINFPLGYFKNPNRLKSDVGPEDVEILKTSGPTSEAYGETTADSSSIRIPAWLTRFNAGD